MSLRGLIASVLFVLCGLPAAANVTVYGSFKYSPDAPGVLVLAGPITDNTVADFRRAVRGQDIRVLFLVSQGGDVQTALELSAIVSDRGLSTVIPPNHDCASACAFVFVAGEKRRAYGRLGVHQFVSIGPVTSGNSVQATQETTAEIIDYLKEYDVAPQFFVRMLETPPDGMYYFPVEELRRHGIETLGTFAIELEQVFGVPELLEPVQPPEPPQEEPAIATAQPPANPPDPIVPSFDCRKAATSTEFAICSDAQIARMDRVMAERYRALRSSGSQSRAESLLASQRAFLARRNRCGGDLNCLNQVYRARLTDLGL
ncbi:MAG: lysozyme inhibitor LprI family protein [Pseudomonadota bacterium]